MAATNIEVWQDAQVTRSVEVADGIRRIELAPQQPKRAEPGSHIDVMVRINGDNAKRSYS
ncbi:oxidoreductase, partial [Escherichia coli]|nr:oxidoreductase [Escherichia coli]